MTATTYNLLFTSKKYMDKNHIKHLKMEKGYIGMKIVKRQEILEQGRVVCYIGLDGHRAGRA